MQWNMQIWNIISTSVYLAQQLLHMISIAWMRLFCKWKIDFVLAIMAMLSTDKEEKVNVFYLWTFELLISRHHHMTRKIHWLFCDWLKRTWHRPLANIKGSLKLCWVPLLRHVHNLDPNAKQNTKTEVFVFWKLKNIRRHYRNIKLICIFLYIIFTIASYSNLGARDLQCSRWRSFVWLPRGTPWKSPFDRRLRPFLQRIL